MKLSISLPDEDIEFLDEYGRAVGAPSRSAVLQQAVRLLRASALGPAYAEAWADWGREGAARDWESVIHDGVDTPESTW